MDFFKKIQKNRRLQYLIGIGSIFSISFVCFLFVDIIGYHVVALILLLAVSILAMLLDIYPIVTVAVLSALIWNFLFIQPRATFNISTSQDALLFLMYFVIAVMNAVFTSKIRKVEKLARERKDREKTLHLYNTLLNSLSHELKTPISTIIGAVDTLKINSTKLSGENIQELFTEIDVAGNRLHRQVENLLSMSRLESNFLKLQLDWYDVKEIVHFVIQKNKAEAIGHTVTFKSREDLPLFKIDGILIEQVIHNIVHNALQYTPPGSHVTITAGYVEKSVILTVTDNGPGFPEDKLEQVFDKFFRLPRSAAGGTGLGLSIAKGFVQAHNGTITVENLPEKGAKFTIVIPTEISSISTYEDD